MGSHRGRRETVRPCPVCLVRSGTGGQCSATWSAFGALTASEIPSSYIRNCRLSQRVLLSLIQDSPHALLFAISRIGSIADSSRGFGRL
ncbi:unnamed protein product [Leptidea sinapis]|uniref:Uncharacterized protein n=1 Tax=Leptidea sinapis TaxID=189913 RepID=A0A5E4R0H2_9NEOP|nr:unnamed protein product [Leptidea sinapis]